MTRPSKPLGGVDEAAKELIIETLAGEETGGFDIDSIYHVPDRGWVVLEFLKCDTVRPHNSHPDRYWFKNKQKFLSLWHLATDLDGELILVNYEESRDQFRIIEIEDLSRDRGIIDDSVEDTDFDGFREFLIGLNRAARDAD